MPQVAGSEDATIAVVIERLAALTKAVQDLSDAVAEMRRDLIGRAEYEADQEGHASAHRDISTALSAARAEAKEQVTGVRLDLSRRIDRHITTLRWILGGIGGAVLVVLAVILPHLRWG